MKTLSFKEIEKLSKEAMREAIVDRRKSLLRMRLASKVDAKSVKPDVVRGLKKEIARLKTASGLEIK